MGGETGVRRALDLRDTLALKPERRAVQLALLPRPAEEGAKPPVDRQEAEVVAEPERGPGRPPGARNRRTQDLVKYVTAKGYGLPIERLAQLYSSDPAQLVLAFNISYAEALEVIKSAAIACLPYLHQKQPVSVDIEGKGTFQLIIGDIGQADPEEIEEGFSLVLDLQANTIESGEKEEGKSDG